MYNLFVALGAALLTAGGILVARFPVAAAVVPGVIVLCAVYVVLARRIGKKIQALGESAQKEVMAQRVPQAIKILEKGFEFAPWQFLVQNELHANIGMLHYVAQEFEKAKPHLSKSLRNNWLARAMLACQFFREKKYGQMETTFEEAVKSGKKEGLAWSTYAWCLLKADLREKALKVMTRAVQTNPTDEKLKANLIALQNDKKLKMKGYVPQWYQFHLERPPPEFGAQGGRRVVFQRR